jgi:hypothetical protein
MSPIDEKRMIRIFTTPLSVVEDFFLEIDLCKKDVKLTVSGNF